MQPKVSIIWLNYNSARFLSLALNSLKSLFDLNYDNYEIIIVDNASSDGSFEAIKNFVEHHKPSNMKVRIIRSKRNRGYSGGNNLGWTNIDPSSKYVVFINNDLIVEPDSLYKIIEFMKSDENVGASSGLIYYGDGKTIYSAGGVVTELWNAGGVCWDLPEYDCYDRYKPHDVSYADGAYMIVNVDIIKNVGVNGKPFLDKAFLYFDDYVLGLLLWNRGYKARYYPVKAGIHYAHKTIKPILSYYGVRAHTALINIVKTRFKPIAGFHVLRRLVVHSMLCAKGESKSCGIVRAIYDGTRLGRYAKDHIGTLTLYRAPYLKSKFEELKCFITGLCEKLEVTFRDLSINQ
jgi:GT2 family glycosyltransferase